MINDRYKILKKLGEGRSRVYLCEDILKAGNKIAVKILSAGTDNDEKKTFRDEYFLLKKLDHPGIISVFDYGTIVSVDEEEGQFQIELGSLFFTLEYFEGQELYEFQNVHQEQILIDIIGQISSVLYYLHQSSYIYYDLKSENILVQQKNNTSVIKFIDFGLTAEVVKNIDISARGTAEYIAPEILKKDKIDHRIDLYSLGILLYRILYGSFPFRNDDQLNIYKAHLDEEFEFPDTKFSARLINLVRKLLSKDPDQRYYTSLGILDEIDSSAIQKYKNEWTRIPNFYGRQDSLSIISTYIEKENSGELLSIKGAEGSGKSTLLEELYYKYPYSLLVSADQSIDYSIWQQLLRGILYHQDVYSKLDISAITDAKKILEGESSNLVEDLKTVIIKLISGRRFILLVDNFNMLSSFDLEIILQIIPVLQVGKIKIVITEDSSYEYKSDVINNLQSINLNPFTESQVTEFVQKSFADFYPKKEIKKAVILYSDVLPGSIEIFLKDLIVLNVLRFTENGPVIEIDGSLDKILKGSHEDIYYFRLNNIDPESRDLSILLSLFNINLDITTITQLKKELSRQQIIDILVKLSEANIIHFNPVLGIVQFTSQGMKEYISATIENIEEAHQEIAELITSNVPQFNINELARHWELAGNVQQTYETLKEELKKARNMSALAYERNLLEHLGKLSLDNESLRNVKIDLSNCLFQMGEYNASISLTTELLENIRSPEEELSLKILMGKALIAAQSLKEGKELLESVLNKIDKNELRNEILAEIAEAEYEMARYGEAENLSDQLIEDKFTTGRTKGKVFRIKGLIELYKNNNTDKTINCFESSLKLFKDENMMAKVAAMENNLGNIFNVINEKDKAEEHWNEAIKINNSIGNLLYNAIILLNFGIYYFERCSYEKAVDYYLQAQSLFKTLGDNNNLGITNINLGEVYLILCEYEKSMDALTQASDIFDELENKIEKGEAVFLLGKLFFEIGDGENLNKVIESYNEFLELNLDKMEFNYSFLKTLLKIMMKEPGDISKDLITLRDKSGSYSDNIIFCEIQVQLIEYLLRNNQIQEAIKELNESDFKGITEKNVYYDSYRNYLTGKVLEIQPDEESGPFLTYYENAFNQIENISITELTWKLLFDLFRVYNERGNITRSSEYAKYAKETIFYIVDQIKSPKLKKLYLEKPERQSVLNTLEQN
jgi:serine/threonine protein kinase